MSETNETLSQEKGENILAAFVRGFREAELFSLEGLKRLGKYALVAFGINILLVLFIWMAGAPNLSFPNLFIFPAFAAGIWAFSKPLTNVSELLSWPSEGLAEHVASAAAVVATVYGLGWAFNLTLQAVGTNVFVAPNLVGAVILGLAIFAAGVLLGKLREID
jgi:hypothetical protein